MAGAARLWQRGAIGRKFPAEFSATPPGQHVLLLLLLENITLALTADLGGTLSQFGADFSVSDRPLLLAFPCDIGSSVGTKFAIFHSC